MKEIMNKKWRLLTFLSMAILTMTLAFGCGDDDDKNNGPDDTNEPPQAQLLDLEGGGRLTKGLDVVPIEIPQGANFQNQVIQDFVDLFLQSITLESGGALSKARSANAIRAHSQTRTGSSVYFVYGEELGGSGVARVVRNAIGNLDAEPFSETVQLLNEFFDFSFTEDLFLGGSVTYVNSKQKNQESGERSVVEMASGKIEVAGKYRGTVTFSNVVRQFILDKGGNLKAGSEKLDGTFFLSSGRMTIPFPAEMIAQFVYGLRDGEYPSSFDLPGFGTVGGFQKVDTVLLADFETTVRVGDEYRILSTVLPYSATNRVPVWTAANAQISEDGRTVIFNQAGEATLTATIPNGVTATGTPYTQNWKVAVVGANAFVPVDTILTDFVLEGQRFTLSTIAGGRSRIGLSSINPAVYPSNANNSTIVWTATNATVVPATADAESYVRFDRELGAATIIATIANGKGEGENYVMTWNVEVVEDVNDPGPTPHHPDYVTGVQLIFGDYTDHRVPLNFYISIEDIKSTAIVSPASAPNKTITSVEVVSGAKFINSNEGIGFTLPIIDGISFNELGTAVIKVVVKDGQGEGRNFEQIIEVEVFQELPDGFIPVTLISFESFDPSAGAAGLVVPQGFEISKEELMNLATVLPANATNSAVTNVLITPITGSAEIFNPCDGGTPGFISRPCGEYIRFLTPGGVALTFIVENGKNVGVPYAQSFEVTIIAAPGGGDEPGVPSGPTN